MKTSDLFNNDTPFGSDFRYENKFMETEKEIDKLTNTNDTHTIDWHKIKDNSFDILLNNSKDIKVFCWLLFAHFRDKDFKNFLLEGENLKILLEKHFKELFPKSKKARSSSLLWLMGKIANFINQHEQSFKELPQSDLQDICNFFTGMDEVTKDFNLDIHTDLNKIVKLFSAFMADETGAIQNKTSNHQLENNDSPTSKNLPVNDSESIDIINNNTDKDLNIDHMNTANAPTNAIQNDPSDVQDNLTQENLSMDELKKKSFAYLKDFLAISVADKNINANFIKINRFISWLDILQAPPCDEENTVMLSPPQEYVINGINLKMENNNFTEAFFDIEDTIIASPFWITAHYLSYKCLENLQLLELANLVKNQILQLISLDDNMLNCVFSNGLELADDNTKKWINEFTTHHTVIAENINNSTANDNINEEIYSPPSYMNDHTNEDSHVTKKELNTGSLTQNMHILQEEYVKAPSLKSQVVTRLKQARLCLDNHKYNLAFQISSEVEKELIKLQIDIWDPPLYCDSLVIMKESLSHIFNAQYHQEVFSYLTQKLTFLNPTVLI